MQPYSRIEIQEATEIILYINDGGAHITDWL
jgi:hypothetical protein